MKRTNVFIDEVLIKKVKKITGAKSMKEAIDVALRSLANSASIYQSLKKLQGKLQWEGNLSQFRKLRK